MLERMPGCQIEGLGGECDGGIGIAALLVQIFVLLPQQ